MMKQFRPVLGWIGIFSAITLLGVSIALFRLSKDGPGRLISSLPQLNIQKPELTREQLADLLGNRRITSNHLKLDYFPISDGKQMLNVRFTLDESLQSKIEDVYERYSPVYAAFVAIEPDTGKILALVDYSTENHEDNLNLRASYPAASVFKVVTSAAALDEKKIQLHAKFAVNGSYGTLYKRNLKNVVNRWTKFISIEEAFAKSVNTVFAKIAMNKVGSDSMQKYANAFGFNQHIPFDMPMETGTVQVPHDDEFGLAESGSGYTRRQTLNPIQGALIASAVINAGKIPAPYMVEKVVNEQGVKIYEAKKETLFTPMDKDTAKSLSMIMEHTITQGTAKKEYRDYNHHPILSKLFVGAKTGSLSGTDPAGRYDWFVGFAQSSTNPKQKIAFASMIVNRKYWKVKAAHVAREGIIQYFKQKQRDEL